MKSSLEIFFYFLKLGATGYGGPFALVAAMQRELVHDRQWMDENEFKQTLTLIKAMPGAFAFQSAVFLGHRRAGVWGAFLAGFGLVLPAFLMMIALGSASSRFESQLLWQSLKKGFQGAALSIIVLALLNLSKPYWKEKVFWILFLPALPIFGFYSQLEPLWIFLFGGLAVLLYRWKSQQGTHLSFLPLVILNVASSDNFERLKELLWVCFKAGALVFGTGLAIVPWLESDFVERLNWMSHHEFLDTIAFGQLLPGPVLVVVTWIGFKTLGWIGAIGAAVAVFSPGFLHMTTWFPRFSKNLLKKKWIPAFTVGALSFVIGSMTFVILKTFFFRPDFLVKENTAQILSLIFGFFVTWKWHWKSWQVILGGGALASIIYFIPQ